MDGVPRASHPVLDSLRGGASLSVLLIDDHAHREAALQGVLSGLPPSTRVVRVGNPLRAPLTLDRILIQLAGPESDLPSGEDARTVLGTVMQHHAGAAHVLLCIEQAETLHAAGLSDLLVAAHPFVAPTPEAAADPGSPALQILFTGTPGFAAVLAHEGMEALRDYLAISPIDVALPAVPMTLDAAPPVVPPPPPVQTVTRTPLGRAAPKSAPDHDMAPLGPPPAAIPDVMVARYARSIESTRDRRPLLRRLVVAGVVTALIGVALGAGMRLFYRDILLLPGLLPTLVDAMPDAVPGAQTQDAAPTPVSPTPVSPAPPPPTPAPSSPAPAIPPVAIPAPASPPLPIPPMPILAPPISAPPIPGPSTGTQDPARLRREFNAFLRMQGSNAASLTEPQRAALFNDFLGWRARGGTPALSR